MDSGNDDGDDSGDSDSNGDDDDNVEEEEDDDDYGDDDLGSRSSRWKRWKSLSWDPFLVSFSPFPYIQSISYLVC